MIYVEDQTIKLNGVVLPGLVKSIEVTESAKVDEQEVEGSATKPKQATGYEDAKVNIELIIDDTQSATKYQRYATLRSIFRKPGQSVPQPMIPVYAVLVKNGKRNIEELPEVYIVPVAEYLATQEEGSQDSVE